MRKLQYIAFLLLALALASCMSSSLLPKPGEYPSFVKGCIFIGKVTETSERVRGELLCANNDSISLLSLGDAYNESKILSYSTKSIENAKLRITSVSDMPGGIIAWSVLLMPLTLTHGWIAVATLPLNFINFLAVTISVSSSYYTLEIPVDIQWEETSKFARFPKGWPKGLDKKSLL